MNTLSVENSEEWKEIHKYAQTVYGDIHLPTCPFTLDEIRQLKDTNELLVFLPANLSMESLCNQFGIETAVNFKNQKLIHNVMVKEPQWFITANSPQPNYLYEDAKTAKRKFEDCGLLTMDMRRYLAFCAAYKYHNGVFPDQKYWTILSAGTFDESGIVVAGFDKYGILNPSYWMKNYAAKFAGTRYILLSPRIEVNEETAKLSRAYFGKRDKAGLESCTH